MAQEAVTSREVELEKKSSIQVPEEESHPSTVEECNLSILRDQDLCDVTFFVGPERKEIKCHKIFLKARSPVFKIKFSGRWDTGSEDLSEVHLPEENPEAFESFLEFIYTDKFSGNLADVMKIIPLANYYDVDPLIRKCEEVMAREYSTYSNTFEIYQSALLYSLTSLINNIEIFIGRNFSTLATHPIIETLDEHTLIRILSRNGLQVEELQLFKMIRRWAEVQMICDPQREGQDEREILKTLITFIRFPLMSLEQFANEVVPSKILPDDQVLDLFMYFSSAPTMRTALIQKIPFSKEHRGLERTIWLYPNEIDPRATSLPVYQASAHAQIDMLSFVYQAGRCLPHRNLVLTGLIIRGPLLLFFEKRLRNSPQMPAQASRQNMSIYIGEKDATGSVKLICSLITKLQPGVTTLFDIPSESTVPLVHGRQYQVIVQYDTCYPLVVKGAARVDPALDPIGKSRLHGSCKDVNHVGSYYLTNFNISTFLYDHQTRTCKSPFNQNTFGSHVVRGLKLAYF